VISQNEALQREYSTLYAAYDNLIGQRQPKALNSFGSSPGSPLFSAIWGFEDSIRLTEPNFKVEVGDQGSEVDGTVLQSIESNIESSQLEHGKNIGMNELDTMALQWGSFFLKKD
jgi:hypothetical protein